MKLISLKSSSLEFAHLSLTMPEITHNAGLAQ